MVFFDNGGHAMVFNSFDGKLLCVLHQPNNPAPAHPVIFELPEL